MITKIHFKQLEKSKSVKRTLAAEGHISYEDVLVMLKDEGFKPEPVSRVMLVYK